MFELHFLDPGEVGQVVVEVLLVQGGGVELDVGVSECFEVLSDPFLGVGHILSVGSSTALSSSKAMMAVWRDCLQDSTVSSGSMIF